MESILSFQGSFQGQYFLLKHTNSWWQEAVSFDQALQLILNSSCSLDCSCREAEGDDWIGYLKRLRMDEDLPDRHGKFQPITTTMYTWMSWVKFCDLGEPLRLALQHRIRYYRIFPVGQLYRLPGMIIISIWRFVAPSWSPCWRKKNTKMTRQPGCSLKYFFKMWVAILDRQPYLYDQMAVFDVWALMSVRSHAKAGVISSHDQYR